MRYPTEKAFADAILVLAELEKFGVFAEVAKTHVASEDERLQVHRQNREKNLK